jgi:hypothetical protein
MRRQAAPTYTKSALRKTRRLARCEVATCSIDCWLMKVRRATTVVRPVRSAAWRRVASRASRLFGSADLERPPSVRPVPGSHVFTEDFVIVGVDADAVVISDQLQVVEAEAAGPVRRVAGFPETV